MPKSKCAHPTYLTYHGYIENHIKPQLGKIPLNDLTTLHLQQFYKKLLAEGRVERIEAQKQPKGLSAKTVRNIHQIISSALKLAIEQRLIARNPADGCALPKAERKEMQTLPVEQLSVLPPRGKGQRRVRPVLHRPDHRPAAGRVARIKMVGH